MYEWDTPASKYVVCKDDTLYWCATDATWGKREDATQYKFRSDAIMHLAPGITVQVA